MKLRVLTPSECAAAPSSSRRVRLGGRVLGVSGRAIELADAVNAVTVRMNEPGTADRGDWLVLEAVRQRETWRDGRVVSRTRSTAPTDEIERLHTRGIGRNLIARAKAYSLLRRYFDRGGFVEVDTPVRVPAAGTDVYIEPMQSEDGFLITSPEFQMKRLLVAGMTKIYQLSHVFRKHEHGALHESEFTLLEWYRACADVSEVMHDTERIVSSIVRRLSGGSRISVLGAHRVECSPPFDRISVKAAFKRYAGVSDASDLATSDVDRYFQILVDSVEPSLARCKRPIFLHDYPISQAALARPKADDPSYAERFELYVGGVELCNGYGELTEPRIQRARFASDNAERRKRGLPEYPVDERFLNALEQGMPDAAGNALGVDRLLALALGARTIAEVMAFPAERLEP